MKMDLRFWSNVGVFVLYTLLMVCFGVHGAVPAFENHSNYIIVPEDTAVGITLITFRVTDADPGDSITVIVNDVMTAKYVTLEVDSNDNDVVTSVILKTEFDREGADGSLITFNFMATDSAFNQIFNHVDVYLTDINDNAPKFQNLPYTLYISEDTPPQLLSANISATDIDSGNNSKISFYLQEEPSVAGIFFIDTPTATLSLVRQLDYEKRNFYLLMVTARDGGGLETKVEVIVHVTDIQDEAPFFIGDPYYGSVNGTETAGHSILTVSARDGDFVNSNSITFSIVSDDCGDIFDIDAVSGEITLVQTVPVNLGKVVCILTVQANEEEFHLPQQGSIQASTDVTIIIKETPYVCSCACTSVCHHGP